jgi:uncharacterized membrane protein
MDESANRKQGDGTFRAILHPHRSLGPKGFLVLMVAIGAISFTTGLVFLSLGAWPVFGFFGLDVLLIYVAFKLNYRSGRAYELVELSPEQLKLTQVAPSGRRKSFEFNPYWVRVRLAAERPDGRTNLSLASHGRELEFGRCLNDDERRKFARVLEEALVSARCATGA